MIVLYAVILSFISIINLYFIVGIWSIFEMTEVGEMLIKKLKEREK